MPEPYSFIAISYSFTHSFILSLNKHLLISNVLDNKNIIFKKLIIGLKIEVDELFYDW